MTLIASFLSLYKNRTKLHPSRTFFTEDNVELPLAEILYFMFFDKDIKLNIFQNLTSTLKEDEIPIILDEYDTGKKKSPRNKSKSSKNE